MLYDEVLMISVRIEILTRTEKIEIEFLKAALVGIVSEDIISWQGIHLKVWFML